MKQLRILSLIVTLLLFSTSTWSQTVVTSDSDIRAAIAVNNANIQLGIDIDLSNSTLSIPSNNTVTIDLNGHTLDRGLTQRGQGGGTVITVRSGAFLTLTNGTIRGGWAGNGGALSNESGTVTATNVTFTDCVADNRGGGICNFGTLTLTNCTISNNRSNDVRMQASDRVAGGGLFNDINATATLNNVTITGNECKEYGGGGICNHGTLTLNGCSITSNRANTNGGGIWQNGTLNMSGANTVSDNHRSTSGKFCNDIYLNTSCFITVTGPLTGSNIGIDMNQAGTFTSGYNTHNTGIDPATFFSPVVPEVMAITLEGTEAQLASTLADGEYYYIDHTWDGEKIIYETKIVHPGEYTLLTSGYYEDTDLFLAGTYVVPSNPNGYKCHYDGIAYTSEDTRIILCDGAKLEIEGVLNLTNHNRTLDIYGQAKNSGVLQTNGNIDHLGDNMAGIGGDVFRYALISFHGGTIIAQGENRTAGICVGIHNTDTSRLYFYDAIVDARGGDNYGAGIGSSGAVEVCCYIDIYGGKVNAHGGNEGAGIGGGSLSKGMDVSIYGGEVNAWGGNDAAGIGGGYTRSGISLKVYGGIVKAWGGGNGAGIGSGSESILTPTKSGGYVGIFGGEVYAYGGVDAAGIGGGEDVDGGVVEIRGGYVYAQGNDWGPGIGGGQGAKGGDVTITGGTVVAKAGRDELECRAIGPGEGCSDYGTLTLGDNLMVSSERKAGASERKGMCWYRTQARIEPCNHSDGFTYTIDGTTAADHHISHCPYCNHSDTALHTFDEHGVCTVCGAQASAYTVKLYMPHDQGDGSFDGQTYDSIATHLVVPGSSYILPLATLKVPSLRFAGWEATTAPTGATYTSPYTTATADTLYRTGNRYTISANISFVARYSGLNITLLDDAGNGETLSRYDGMQAASVTLSGRTLYKDNDWNTLCLPFSLSAEQLTASPLAGATLMELDTEGTYDTDKQTGFDPGTGTLYLYFKSATGIEAGKPYIIKWASGDNIENPVFENVTISNLTSDVSAPYLTFKGTYSHLQYTEEDRKLLFLGSGNQLHFPDGEGTTDIGSCRAYFRVQELLLSASLAAPLRIVMNLDADHTATTLENALPEDQRGRKFLRNGILYIEHNGILYNALGQLVESPLR